ncbi:MAG: putative toxin-antitoxin system toxin component, PIN family [Vicinamibacterales bacterium]
MRINRVVIDTNVFISGLISTTSPPARVIDHAVAFGRLVATRDTLEELIATVFRSKFDALLSRTKRQSTLDRLVPLIEIVPAVRVVRACRDPRDDMFLEAAVNGSADVIVTGDKDLLALHPFAGIAIVTPADYLSAVEPESE